MLGESDGFLAAESDKTKLVENCWMFSLEEKGPFFGSLESIQRLQTMRLFSTCSLNPPGCRLLCHDRVYGVCMMRALKDGSSRLTSLLNIGQ